MRRREKTGGRRLSRVPAGFLSNQANSFISFERICAKYKIIYSRKGNRTIATTKLSHNFVNFA